MNHAYYGGTGVTVRPGEEVTFHFLSDFHAGAKPIYPWSEKLRAMEREQVEREQVVRTWTKMYAFGDLLPTQAKEATPMHTLYAVTLIDSAGNIELDRKVVAKGPEAAKLKAGVYGWCEEHAQTLDDVTVLVSALGQVKVGA